MVDAACGMRDTHRWPGHGPGCPASGPLGPAPGPGGQARGPESLSGTAGRLALNAGAVSGAGPPPSSDGPGAGPGVILTGVPQLDALLGGLRPPGMVLFEGPPGLMEWMTARICAGALEGTDGGLVFLDGGNSADPHAIAAMCRLRGVGRSEALRRTMVARAFTAYQMDSLVNSALEEAAAGCGARVVVVSRLLDLFLDPDVPWREGYQLVKRCAYSLSDISERLGVLAVVTSFGSEAMRRSRALHRLMYSVPDRVVRLEFSGRGIRASLPREGPWVAFRPVPPGQTTLDRFTGQGARG